MATAFAKRSFPDDSIPVSTSNCLRDLPAGPNVSDMVQIRSGGGVHKMLYRERPEGMNKSVSGDYVLLGCLSNVTSGNDTLHPLRCVIVKLGEWS